jgi:ribonuclease P protein component
VLRNTVFALGWLPVPVEPYFLPAALRVALESPRNKHSVLPRNARLTSPDDFARTTKNGFRVTSKSLVGYLYLTGSTMPAICGLIISKSVGGSVVRHRVARQLRHCLQDHLNELPLGALVVIRALPRSTTTNFKEELSTLIPKLVQKSKVSR